MKSCINLKIFYSAINNILLHVTSGESNIVYYTYKIIFRLNYEVYDY